MAASLRDCPDSVIVYSQSRKRESTGRQLRYTEVGNCGRTVQEPRERGTSAVGSCYQATASEDGD
jgi:hypothetical protein